MDLAVPSFGTFALLALAVFRITHLITDDSLLDRPRDWWLGHAGYWADLGQCAWCVSVWVALGAWASWQWWPTGTTALAVIPALSAIAALGSQISERINS